MTELPKGVQLTVLDEVFRDNPYPILRRIQSTTPILVDDELGQHLSTHHADVKTILRDKEMWSDPRKGNPGSFQYEFLGGKDNQEPSMLLMDEPDHKRLRTLVSKPFMPAEVEKWRPRTRQVVDRMLAKISEPEFELVNSFAGPVPTVVIAELLGIDPGHHEAFKDWSDKMIKTSFNPFPEPTDLETAQIAGEAIDGFLREEIARRREQPGDDLLSQMIRAEAEGDKLTEDELVQQCLLLLIAGNVTTTDLIANGMKALLDNPDQLQKLRDNPALIKNAVEEMLRFDSPVTNSGRIPNRDIEVQGCPVKKGESLTVSLAAANHDPSVYPDPERFDIEREDTHHQSFGGGKHMCLGAHLARVEAQEAILALLEKYPVLKHGSGGFARAAVPGFRGMEYFWVSSAS